jgi:hypothetical protein
MRKLGGLSVLSIFRRFSRGERLSTAVEIYDMFIGVASIMLIVVVSLSYFDIFGISDTKPDILVLQNQIDDAIARLDREQGTLSIRVATNQADLTNLKMESAAQRARLDGIEKTLDWLVGMMLLGIAGIASLVFHAMWRFSIERKAKTNGG